MVPLTSKFEVRKIKHAHLASVDKYFCTKKALAVLIFLRCEILQGSTYRFEVVILHIWEVLSEVEKQQGKSSRATRTKKTDFETNVIRAKSRERKLDAKKPVKLVRLT
jgi:hypothetical protein